MNIVVDAGNSFFKAGLFEGDTLQGKETFNEKEKLKKFLQVTPHQNFLISSVSLDAGEFLSLSKTTGQKLVMDSKMRLPIRVHYATIETLGVDRLAAACAAWTLFPNHHSLVIDAGTCINYEFVDADGTYKGGAISPGVKMRFESMHRHTAKLPLAPAVQSPPLTGDSTVGCLQSGVMNGMLEEIKGVISLYTRDYPGVRVILCGGDAHFFENDLKPSIFVAPDLVLIGLNSILLYHVVE